MGRDTNFQLLAEHASDVVVEGDNHGVIQWVSPSVESVLGWRPDQVVGRPIAQFITDDDLATLSNAQRVVLAGEKAEFEVRMLRCDGTQRWMSIVVRPVVDSSGRVVSRVAGWRDVHDVVTSRLESHVRQQRFELLAENASDVVGLTGRDRRLQWVSETVTASLGWSPEELIGTMLLDLVHPEDRPAIEAMLPKIYAGTLRSTPADGITARLRTRSGEYRWMAGRSTGIVDHDGRVIEVISGLKDVHELMLIRQRLDAERATLQATIDSLIDPHVLLVAVRENGSVVDFEVRMANLAAARTLGGRDKFIGVRLTGLGLVDTSKLFERFLVVLTSGEPLVLDGAQFDGDPRAAGRRFDVRIAKVLDGVTFTWRDTTERWIAAAALEEAEEHYQLIAENASDIVFRADLDARLEWISPSITQVLGFHPDEIVGHFASEFMHPDDRETLAASTAEVIASGTSRYEARFQGHDGSYRWMSLFVNGVRNRHGHIVGRAGSFRDVQIEVETRAALHESEQRLRSAMDATAAGLAIVGLDRQFIEVNTALCRLVDRDRSWLLRHGIADIVGDDDNEMDLELRLAARSSEHGSAMSEKRLRTSSGVEIWVEHSVGVITDPDGVAVSYVSQFTDITDIRLGHEQLRHDATHDALTHLANRRELVERATEILAHPPRNGARVAVAFIDVDGLKAVNDSRGHLVGDHLIVTIAHRIRQHVRADDVVARFGGDEFVVLLPEVGSVEAAVAVADHLRFEVSRPVQIDGVVLAVSASVGVTLVEPGEHIAAVLERADTAMYEAKRTGRDRTVCVSGEPIAQP